ncbi:hypothetical protein [Burkholderia sp. PU8-34]
MSRLDGHRAAVTGAARGPAIAQRLAAAGGHGASSCVTGADLVTDGGGAAYRTGRRHAPGN